MRYELGSAEWFAMIHTVFRERVRAALVRDPDQDLSFSMSEAFDDPPPHIGNGRSRIGWSCRAVSGEVSFWSEQRADIDYKIVAKYEDMLPLVRYRIGGDPQRASSYAELGAALYHAGKVTIEGRPPALPAEFATFHDAVAELTL